MDTWGFFGLLPLRWYRCEGKRKGAFSKGTRVSLALGVGWGVPPEARSRKHHSRPLTGANDAGAHATSAASPASAPWLSLQPPRPCGRCGDTLLPSLLTSPPEARTETGASDWPNLSHTLQGRLGWGLLPFRLLKREVGLALNQESLWEELPKHREGDRCGANTPPHTLGCDSPGAPRFGPLSHPPSRTPCPAPGRHQE